MVLVVLPPKNANNCSVRKLGRSSVIQCPVSGIVPPFTFVASKEMVLKAKKALVDSGALIRVLYC